MVVVQASKLNLLPNSSSSFSLSSPQITSLLFDPNSLFLALMHSDSSFSLYPSLSPFSISSLPPPQILVPPPSSSATFLFLQNPNPSSASRHLFLVSSPLLGGFGILLRFYILQQSCQSFTKARVICNQRDLNYDNHRLGVVCNVSHGVSIKLVGSINVFAMYSVSNCKIWVFAVKMAGNEDDGATVKLMKSAVIDCHAPVFSISVSFGFLILGEENGVRIFPLRPLVKGKVKKQRKVNKNLDGGLENEKLEGGRSNLPNGMMIQSIDKSDHFYGNSVAYSNCRIIGSGAKSVGNERTAVVSSIRHLEEKTEKQRNSVKLRSVKLRQDSREGGACYVELKSTDVGCLDSTKKPLKSAKAISIQALGQNKFLILDSVGNLHLLYLSNPVHGSENPFHVKQLAQTMKVQKLAVLPDISSRTQTIWISDGHHTLHMMVGSDVDTSANDSDGRDNEEKLKQISVIEAIFSSEKIQEITPLAANAVLVLGQASIFAYAIS